MVRRKTPSDTKSSLGHTLPTCPSGSSLAWKHNEKTVKKADENLGLEKMYF